MIINLAIILDDLAYHYKRANTNPKQNLIKS